MDAFKEFIGTGKPTTILFNGVSYQFIKQIVNERIIITVSLANLSPPPATKATGRIIKMPIETIVELSYEIIGELKALSVKCGHLYFSHVIDDKYDVIERIISANGKVIEKKINIMTYISGLITGEK